MRRISLAAAATLAIVPIGGPAEAGERQRAAVLMAEDEGARKFQENLGSGITEIRITARRPETAGRRG